MCCSANYVSIQVELVTLSHAFESPGMHHSATESQQAVYILAETSMRSAIDWHEGLPEIGAGYWAG